MRKASCRALSDYLFFATTAEETMAYIENSVVVRRA
jgi:hypothetical protein